jgi:HEAT repeat protein
LLSVLATGAPGQKFKSDPVEALRAVLRDRDLHDPGPPTAEEKDNPEAYVKRVQQAAARYQDELTRAVARLTNPADIVQALVPPDRARLASEALDWSRPSITFPSGPLKKVLDEVFSDEVGKPGEVRDRSYRDFVKRMGEYAEKERKVEASFAAQARAAESDARKAMMGKLARTLSSGPVGHRTALCHLLREAMAGAWILGSGSDGVTAYDELSTVMIEPLARAATTGDPEVRAAACQALSRFHLHADEAAQALGKSLAAEAPRPVRQAAAEALDGLIQSAAAPERLRRSEPGVSVGDAKAGTQSLPEDVKAGVAAAVARAAPLGSKDESAMVRRPCMLALQLSAGHLASTLTDQAVRPSRDPKAPKEGPGKKARPLGEMAALIRALANSSDALRHSLLDSDAETRLHSRATLTILANAVNRLNEAAHAGKGGELSKAAEALEKVVVEAVKDVVASGLGDPSAASRRAGAEAGEALSAARASVAQQAEADLRARRDDLAAATRALAADPENKARKKARDEAEEDVQLAEARFQKASARVDEVAALIGKPLLQGLKDDDAFVRWISARIVGILARDPEVMVPALAENFTDRDLDSRKAAIRAIGQYGPTASTAVPALARLLGRGDAEVRLSVLKALEGIGKQSVAALPAAVGELAHPDPRVRIAAATLVGRFEERARPYIEALRKLNADPDSEVRRAASAALLAIPEE